jgi:hypothetical protein
LLQQTRDDLQLQLELIDADLILVDADLIPLNARLILYEHQLISIDAIARLLDARLILLEDDSVLEQVAHQILSYRRSKDFFLRSDPEPVRLTEGPLGGGSERGTIGPTDAWTDSVE